MPENGTAELTAGIVFVPMHSSQRNFPGYRRRSTTHGLPGTGVQSLYFET